jgi:hypothetical protein
MLISHSRRFIYLKTKKTGGTSVEIYFERECVPPQTYKGPAHLSDEQVSEYGIVGYRGNNPKGLAWYNHMPARRVRDQIGKDIWENYFKFCVIRNPFDKVVSWWWFWLGLHSQAMALLPFAQIREAFVTTIRNGAPFPVDRDIYEIDGQFCVDRFVRYEHLNEELADVSRHLGISFNPADVGRYKSEFRKRPERFSEYYDQATAQIVAAAFDKELKYFSYDLGG